MVKVKALRGFALDPRPHTFFILIPPLLLLIL